MARPPGNPHDSFIKYALQDPAHAATVLRSALPSRLARAIDWTTLRRKDITLVEPALRELRSDFLFTVQLAGREVQIYVLFEHQSERDPWMALRLLGYMTRLWEEQRKESGGPLSPILPIVLYHGDEPWTHGMRLGDLFELPPELLDFVREHTPDFSFSVDDLRRQDDAQLRARALTELATIALVLLRDARRGGDPLALFGPWLETFRTVAAAPDGLNAMLAVIHYLSRVSQTDRVRLQTFAREIGPTAERATMTAAEEIANEAETRGLKKGREQGLEQGLEQGRRETLLKLITLKFGALDEGTLHLFERVTPEQLSDCVVRVLTATTLDELLAPYR